MCDVPVFYATTGSQTHRIAEHIAGILRARGFDSRAIDIDALEPPRIDWRYVQAAFLGASVRNGRHEQAARAFARRYNAELTARPSAFFSVGSSAGSGMPLEKSVGRYVAEAFTKDVRWQPTWTVCFTASRALTRSERFAQFLRRWIGTPKGSSTPVSRDHDQTDWPEVARLANQMGDAIRQSKPAVSTTTSSVPVGVR